MHRWTNNNGFTVLEMTLNNESEVVDEATEL